MGARNRATRIVEEKTTIFTHQISFYAIYVAYNPLAEALQQTGNSYSL